MINIGQNQINQISVGSTPVQSVYVGSTQVWSNAQWHTIYEGDGHWFSANGRSSSGSWYTYHSIDVDYGNVLDGLDFKPNTKYRIWITKLDRDASAGATSSITYKTADTIDPMYIECDDNFEIRLNSTFAASGDPDHNRIYTLFHVVDGKLVCTAYYATNNPDSFGYIYYVSLLVTKIEQYY